MDKIAWAEQLETKINNFISFKDHLTPKNLL